MMKRSMHATIVALALFAVPALAFNPSIQQNGLPSASQYSNQVLPELQGVVSWKTLAQVTPVKHGAKVTASFSKDIQDLDRKKAVVQGFMMPLEMGADQKHFLVSAVPPSCPFCLPAGPEAIVEVLAKKPVRYAMEPVLLSGTFAVLPDHPSGMLYRLTEAEVVETQLK
jgi:hypothetical protein